MHMYLSQKGNIKYNRSEAVLNPIFLRMWLPKHLITLASSPVASFTALVVGCEQRRA